LYRMTSSSQALVLRCIQMIQGRLSEPPYPSGPRERGRILCLGLSTSRSAQIARGTAIALRQVLGMRDGTRLQYWPRDDT
jgi:hypothetical protein